MKEPEDHKEIIFNDDTLKSLIELGEVLRPVYAQMISEGYVVKDGHIMKPASKES